MKPIKIVFFLAFLLGSGLSLFSQNQNTVCSNPTPFCTGQTMSFPAQTGNSQAQSGPNYGCLGSQPRPTWFYMQIASAGSIVITMAANNDIDFIAWGPFSSLTGACSNLTSSTQVPGSGYGNPNSNGCSFSGSNTETVIIQNAQPGQFYLLLITNYSGANQNITFQQQNSNQPGAASTNCGMVCLVTATNSGLICANQNNTISLTTSSAVTSYTWFGPNSYSSTSAMNVVSSLSATSVFTVRGTANSTINNVPSSGTCQATTTITVVPFPNFSISLSSPTICQGGITNAQVAFSPGSGSGPFTYTWAPATGAGLYNTNLANTLIGPPLLPLTQSVGVIVYSVTVSPSAAICPITNTFAITINNPLTPTLNMPPPMCNTSPPVNLTASPGGGTWTLNGAVSPTGLLSPNLATSPNNTVMYSVSAGTCIVSNTGTFSVSKFNTAAFSGTVGFTCVQDAPVNLMGIVQNTTGSWAGGPFVISNSFVPTGLATGNYTMMYRTFSAPLQSVCPDSMVLTVPLFNPPTPTINPIIPKCNINSTVALTAMPPGGVWSLNSGVSSTGVQTPSSNVIGTNSVLYTAGIGTCVASKQATFQVSQFNTAALSGTVPHMCEKGSPFNLMSIVQSSLTGIWGGPNVITSGPGSYSFNPTGLPTAIYTLTYSTFSTPNPNTCPQSSTIQASLLNPPDPFISAAGPFCTRGGSVQLSVTPPNSGTWTAFSYVNTSGVFLPSLAAVGSNIVQYITGTSTCSAQQTRTISVEAFVPATINSHPGDLCNTGSAVNLMPITVSGSGTWMGPGILGSNFNPSVAGAGTHIISYNTSSMPSGLCPDQATLAVRVFSLADPVVTKAGPFCNTSPALKLLVNPVGGIFGGANNLAVTPQGLFNPGLGIIGNNIVSYSISSGPCIAYGQTTISIERFVSADFATPQPITFCQGDEAINMDSYVINPGGLWAGPGINGNIFDPKKANPGSNNFIIYQTYSTPNALLCPDTSAVRITVNETPTVEISSSSFNGCSPLEVVLTAKAISTTGGGKADWVLGDGSESSDGLTISHIFKSPGSYSVITNYFSNKGCKTQAMLKTPIVVKESPKANFVIEPEEVSITDPHVGLNNLSTVLNNNRYQWTIQGMNQVFEISPQITLPAVGKYIVKLEATSFDGCKDEITRIIEVKNDFNVFIPSSFSPNSDGLNDYFFPVFSPYGLDANSFEMDIFDRWGHVLYHTNDPRSGWDGTTNNKGEATLKQDNYVYMIRFRDLEGRIYKKTGTFTLLQGK